MPALSVTGHAIPDKAFPINQEGFFVYLSTSIKHVLDPANVLSKHGLSQKTAVWFKQSPFKKSVVNVEN
jgi:hypothetical protein